MAPLPTGGCAGIPEQPQQSQQQGLSARVGARATSHCSPLIVDDKIIRETASEEGIGCLTRLLCLPG